MDRCRNLKGLLKWSWQAYDWWPHPLPQHCVSKKWEGSKFGQLSLFHLAAQSDDQSSYPSQQTNDAK